MHWKQEFIAATVSLLLALPAFGQAGNTAAPGTPPNPNAPGSPPDPNAPPRASTGTPPDPSSATRASTDRGEHPTGTAGALAMLHRSNQSEIAMANLAKERSTNKAVKDYADMIISDHKKADDEIQSFAKAHNIDMKQDLHAMQERHQEKLDSAAQSRGVQTPTGEYARPMPGAGTGGGGMEHKKAIDDLAKLNGPEFDRQFVKTMVDGHRKVIEHLKTIRSNATTDRDLAQLIDKLLPTQQKHETAAQQLESRLSKAS